MQSSKLSRPLLPKPRGDEAPQPSIPLKRKRDRALAACENCRKRKIKCDSSRPSCVPCRSARLDCVYPVPEGMTQRAAQRQQLETAAHLRVVLDLLRSSSSRESLDITRRIREAPSLDAAVDLIKDAALLVLPGTPRPQLGKEDDDEYPSSPVRQEKLPGRPGIIDIPIPSSVSPSPYHRSLSDRHDGLPANGESIFEPTITTLPVSRWTAVSNNDIYLTHLLNLFWTWDHSVSRVLDRTMFLDALKSSPGVEVQFCSEFLVNCILAVSTLYLRRDSAFRTVDPALRKGRPFAQEAHRILSNTTGRPSITLIQGLGMLWVYEGNSGSRQRAATLLETFFDAYQSLGLDVDMTHLGALSDPMAERRWEAVSFICWGMYSMEVKASMMLSRKTRIGKPSIAKAFENPSSSLADSSSEEYLWSPYPATGQAKKASHFREAFCAECRLVELTDKILAEVNDPKQAASWESRGRLRGLYDELMNWNMTLPKRLQNHGNVPPSITFLHATFDMAVLKLLEPLSGIFPDPNGDTTVESLRLNHGISIISTLLGYRAAHGLRHDYWLTQSCYAAAVAVITGVRLETNAVAADTFSRACQLLYDMSDHLPLAADLLLAVKARMYKGGMVPPPSVARIFAALASRTGHTFVRGARLALPIRGLDVDGSDGLGVYSPGGAPSDVAFSRFILGIGEPTRAFLDRDN
ncbi:Nitrogen assimilation transcription factor nira [Pleurostoma richardsiae]|uniref:Nitrogen assimilation transcription factor nira n=1 Tax=Pleurostoma richardsiae TaxID=41990 RepID=A0AA38VL38_9PEZI|nr:Nitrogen assimilation transcription factor nira [Pleurostoma richardsiae]